MKPSAQAAFDTAGPQAQHQEKREKEAHLGILCARGTVEGNDATRHARSITTAARRCRLVNALGRTCEAVGYAHSKGDHLLYDLWLDGAAHLA